MPSSLSYSSLIPPNLFILAAMIGVVLTWRWNRFGLALTIGATGCLYLVSTPFVAYFLLRSAEAMAGIVSVAPQAGPPGAIVVLSADERHSDVPGEPDTVGPLTLERLAEAARLQRRLGLPVLVSGGRGNPTDDDSLASLMSGVLQDDFGVKVRWREERSRNTFENASFSAAILRQDGVPSALVVTHPWDLARALLSFRTIGYPVISAPVPDGRALSWAIDAWLPQIPALLDSYHALHELLGLVWYRCRYADW
jgi:uncharacterized SAM-binding protein YcdF (DUF218 family)